MALVKALTALSVLAFLLAVATNFLGVPFVSAEGFSRASGNLALIAIALLLMPRNGKNRA